MMSGGTKTATTNHKGQREMKIENRISKNFETVKSAEGKEDKNYERTYAKAYLQALLDTEYLTYEQYSIQCKRIA